jgi:Short C-terminal domain
VPDPATAGGPGPVHQANLGSWWPGELGRPGSSGGQADSRYAVFPQARRLAVQSGGGSVRVYDTLDHVIGGVQQQQGSLPGTLSFTSQHGTFTVESLPLASPAQTTPPASESAAPPNRAAPDGTDADAVLAALERLGNLHERGVLTDEEFAAKKAELLSRL